MVAEVENFRDNLIESGYVLDPKGVHHEFVSGVHGQKLDFGNIPLGSELFQEWVDVVAQEIDSLYLRQGVAREELLILSVATGTDRVVGPVAQQLGTNSALTEKDGPKSVKLPDKTVKLIEAMRPAVAVALEDAGTSGTSSATAVQAARDVGIPRVEALITWQRSEILPKLIGIKAVHHAIIYEPRPNYAPEDCQTEGYCAQGWKLIRRLG